MSRGLQTKVSATDGSPTRHERNGRFAADADAEVLNIQLGYDLGDLDWISLDSSGSRDDTLAAGLDILGVRSAL